MANTKIINLKRYSKKRVPKKVLKGGGRLDKPAHRVEPNSRELGQTSLDKAGPAEISMKKADHDVETIGRVPLRDLNMNRSRSVGRRKR